MHLLGFVQLHEDQHEDNFYFFQTKEMSHTKEENSFLCRKICKHFTSQTKTTLARQNNTLVILLTTKTNINQSGCWTTFLKEYNV